MPLDVNEDQEGDVVYSGDDLEAFFPGCVIRKGEVFTMNHDRLTTRYIMAIKATTELTKEEFLAIMERRWERCEVDSVEKTFQ
jgi:hypothetical protein